MLYLILLILVVVLGVVLWRMTQAPGDSTPRRPTPRGPIGPDDDPDFLLDLRRKNQDRDS
ncbi:MAG TPA: hypothetical protein PK331_14105 [Gordonia sp. (in: high G+C Gram-positive bacteria)]|uniref:hypothetical protein n=1 Tax=unclassified Gordonia (in: high G+C Gram-positive bacteria) TaxID=2657482 RepID=UPI000FBD0BD1|nr:MULTISPECIES: hypothetical protein [unclassified Gordonia (in: high G+C Gram-positive bacteria)]RUP39606.1 MAG: hypothetical protein EKK60_06145 [Gordonia sp. (in: high G+C Gram-positive bacteria)]HNP57045.1 hypothetical protein [Gordonia sp. (in: high G+C Gram-positive bacteria)]HRC52039.1 hypothetical protein [Gordonia sp. (in: high G+C Gram-positive bacteria)]